MKFNSPQCGSNGFNAMALALFLACGPACAEDATLGRLFFTPEQRAGMDLERLTGVPGAGGSGASVKLNGIIRNRASGDHTIWLNGVPWHGKDRLTGASPAQDNPASARITTASGAPVEVRVGQITDRATGQNSAPLADKSITIHREAGRER
ncbi:MAG: hypothetical protein PHU46_09985 [Rhodocyclaceae bacterium]|nr:hypothetical protein [Rhodocyclaceae bacterium]